MKNAPAFVENGHRLSHSISIINKHKVRNESLRVDIIMVALNWLERILKYEASIISCPAWRSKKIHCNHLKFGDPSRAVWTSVNRSIVVTGFNNSHTNVYCMSGKMLQSSKAMWSYTLLKFFVVFLIDLFCQKNR